MDPGLVGLGRRGTVRPEMIWAALDCPSGIAAAEAAGLAGDTAVLLGQMTASLAELPMADDQCLVIAWPVGRDGRKLRAGSALLGPGGKVIAAARAVWLTVSAPGSGASRRRGVVTAAPPRRGAHADGDPTRCHRPRRRARRRAGVRDLRAARGLGTGLGPGADRDRACAPPGSTSPPASCRSGGAPRERWR